MRGLSLTVAGKGLLFIGVFSVVVGFTTAQNLVFFFVALFFALLVVDALITWVLARSLKISRSVPCRIVAGSRYEIEYSVSFSPQIPGAFVVLRDDLLESEAVLFEGVTTFSGSIMSRGVYETRGFTVSFGYPFGFFRFDRIVSHEETIFVWPRLDPQGFESQGSDDRSGDNRFLEGFREEYRSLRDYQVGDEFRDINWKRSASTDRLVVREYEAPVSNRGDYWLTYTDSCKTLEDGELALSGIAYEADRLTALSIPFGLRGSGSEIGISSGRTHLESVFNVLSSVHLRVDQ
jgi:uncharacterized protein (DUF58 family)